MLLASAITITGVVVFAYVLVHATLSAPDDSGLSLPLDATSSDSVAQAASSSSGTVSSPKKKPPAAPGYFPATLVVPKLSISARVQYVGVNGKGNMGVPSNFTDVAWYEPGTPPGKKGAAVIDGHLDNGLGLRGVFWNLSQLAPGDDVEVVTRAGDAVHFIVSQVESYPYDDPSAADAVFAETDVPTVRLVTCEGNWVQADKTYDKRLVVTATLAGS